MSTVIGYTCLCSGGSGLSLNSCSIKVACVFIEGRIPILTPTQAPTIDLHAVSATQDQISCKIEPIQVNMSHRNGSGTSLVDLLAQTLAVPFNLARPSCAGTFFFSLVLPRTNMSEITEPGSGQIHCCRTRHLDCDHRRIGRAMLAHPHKGKRVVARLRTSSISELISRCSKSDAEQQCSERMFETFTHTNFDYTALDWALTTTPFTTHCL